MYKDVTFDPVPLYIICMRLGPSIPGVYVNPGFWTPKIRVLQKGAPRRMEEIHKQPLNILDHPHSVFAHSFVILSDSSSVLVRTLR
jgi:hypothetical protein